MKTDNPSLIYGLDHECRALCSQYSEQLPSRFFIGTQSLLKLNENQIHLIEYVEESNSLLKLIFKHNLGEIWHIISFTKNPQKLITGYSSHNNNKIENNFTIWTIPIDITDNLNENENVNILSLDNNCTFDKFDENFGHICRLKPDDENELLLCLETKLAYIDIETKKLKNFISNHSTNTTSTTTSNRLSKISNCHWSPHFNSNIITLISNNNIYAKDLRQSSSSSNNNTWHVSQAHSQIVRDMDFNPNSQYYFVTCGDDCVVKFWDIRDTTKPVIKMLHHTHWIWSVRYNSFHDHLVLSSSSDGNVNLLKVSSIASQPLIEPDDDDDKSMTIKNELNNEDRLIKKYEDHADSVYSVEWSPNDPWIFASLSYDGRLIINRVPEEEKMNILV